MPIMRRRKRFCGRRKPSARRTWEAAFDSYWGKAADYDPHVPMPTDKERIAQLEEQNTMLTECILEMSEIVYG